MTAPWIARYLDPNPHLIDRKPHTMSKVQLLAFETSGLKPAESRILEVGIATLDTKTDDVDAESWILDPGSADMSEEILAFHRKSGLLDELIEAGRKGTLSRWQEVKVTAAHIRFVWSRDFIAPFFEEPHTQIGLSGCVHGSTSFDVLRSIGAAVYGIETPKPERSRVADKLAIMLSLVRAMRAGAGSDGSSR